MNIENNIQNENQELSDLKNNEINPQTIENNNKKNSSLSLTSFDNITNNKIIFDKHTKKMLDKSETELKNNNYYNTLVLETPRSINFSNNGLISKRTGDSNSFEKCIHALVEYQYYKNKKIKIKNEKKENVKNKKIKNFLINNEKNSCKFYKIINNISQSHRITNKSVNHKMYYQKGKLYNKYIMINSSNSSYINNDEKKIPANAEVFIPDMEKIKINVKYNRPKIAYNSNFQEIKEKNIENKRNIFYTESKIKYQIMNDKINHQAKKKRAR